MSGCHRVDRGQAIFGITDLDPIGGQLAAGFVLTGFDEDIDTESILGTYLPTDIAARASKPKERPGTTS
jgi:hypothetical protein